MAKKGLPKGLGDKEALNALRDSINSSAGIQAAAINELTTSVNDRLTPSVEEVSSSIDNNLTPEIQGLKLSLETQFSKKMDELIKLFEPVSRAAKNAEEDAQQASPTVIPPTPGAMPPEPSSAPVADGNKVVRNTPNPVSGAMGAIGGVLAGVGGAAAGAGAGALGAGLRVLAPALAAMGNPATALGATVLVGFLAGLAGVAWLAGKALESLGDGMSSLSVGLDDLAQAEYPDEAQLKGLVTALKELLGAFDTSDAIKMRIADGTMFSDLATGLTDLNNAQLDPTAITAAGDALGAFMNQIDLGDAAVMRIMTGDAFGGIADGLQRLNDIQVDDANLARAGTSLKAFLENVAGFSSAAGAGIMGVLGSDTLVPLADGLSALQQANIDPDVVGNAGLGLNRFLSQVNFEQLVGGLLAQGISKDPMIEIADGLLALQQANIDPDAVARAGLGLEKFMSYVNFEQFVGGLMARAISKDNLIEIADGVQYLSDTGATVDIGNIQTLAAGVETILDPAMNLVGIAGLASVDDNLIPFADGMSRINDVAATIDPEAFARFTGAADSLISTGNNLLGIAGLQGIDDNLIPLADGMTALQNAAVGINPADFDNIKLALRKLMAGITGQEEGDGIGAGLIKGITGAISSFAVPDISDLAGIGEIFGDLGDVATLDSDTINANLIAMKNAVKLMDDDNLGEFDKFSDFVDMTARLESLNPERLNAIINTVRDLGVEIASGFKPTAARLEEQRQRVPDQSGGMGNINTSVNAPRVSNQVNNNTNMTSVTYSPPIPPRALMFS